MLLSFFLLGFSHFCNDFYLLSITIRINSMERNNKSHEAKVRMLPVEMKQLGRSGVGERAAQPPGIAGLLPPFEP